MKYTDFLLATASGKVEGVKAPGKLATPFERTKIAAYTLGAMTPCMRLYAFLGKEFQALLDNNGESHPYQKWIDNYSSESFQVRNIIERWSFFILILMVILIKLCFLPPRRLVHYINVLYSNTSTILIFEFRHQLCKLKSCSIN